MLVGITEPLEFTFLFISPLLFAVHAVLAATMATVMYVFGVVGNMGAGCLTSSCRKTGSRCSTTTHPRCSPR
jgi:phosphotransferase system  glucose/maltose/N-acetylglucosamine-specific IIC component